MSADLPLYKSLKIDSSTVGRYTIAHTELLDARRVLAFVAGINDTNKAYWSNADGSGLRVHPAIAFALEFNSQAKLGFSTGPAEAWLGAVHAETDLRIWRPFRLGDVITTQGRVISRRQLRSGVLNVERYLMTDADGVLVAEMDFGLILRSATLGGGDISLEAAHPRPAPPEDVDPGPKFVVPIPRNALHQYTAGSGIYAPIHTDLEVARDAGFKDIVLQGSATKAIALTHVIDNYFDGDGNRIRRLYGQLRSVILADTHLQIDVVAVCRSAEGLKVFFRVLNHEGQEAISHGLVAGEKKGTAR